MTNKDVILIGAEEDIILELNNSNYKIHGFFGNKKKANIRYLGTFSKIDSFLKKKPKIKICIAMGPLNIRKKFLKKYKKNILTYISDRAFKGIKIKIGKGSFIQSYCFLGNNLKIGYCCKINVRSNLHHGVIVGSFTDIAPNSTVLGNAVIGSECYIGSGTIIREKLKISNQIMTGINSAVVKNLNIKGLYYGVPAKLKKKNSYSRP